MIIKIVKGFIGVLILAGLALTYSNFTARSLEAGQISKYGTYIETKEGCPGPASNCVDVWHVDDDVPDE